MKKRDSRKVRRWAEFTSSLPTDLIEDDDGFIQYGGKSVAEAIAEILRGLGCVVQQPQHAYEHGWDFKVLKEGVRFWCQVTLIHGYIFIFDNPSFIDKWLNRDPPEYFEVLGALAAAMAKDPRFFDVRWAREALDDDAVSDPLADV